MRKAQTHKKKTYSNAKPKHKHTKEYLKHYYPFLPVLISLGFLVIAILLPVRSMSSTSVKGVETSELQSNILDSTNSARYRESLTELTANQQLTDAAETKAKDMVRRNYWSHTTPEGDDPWQFIKNVGYGYSTAGENLAYGFTNSDNVVNAWLSSPSHRENLLSNDFKEVGIGTAVSSDFKNNGPTIVVVAMYANPSQSQQTNTTTGVLGASDTPISLISSSTGTTWSRNVILTLTTLGILYLLASHSLAVKKVLHKGELFIVRHPVLDSLVIIVISGGLILLKTNGSVL